MAYAVLADVVMPSVVMAYTVIAYVVMTCVAMAYIVMAISGYGLCELRPDQLYI